MARLYVLLARESDRAIVFRRGPTKQVLLLDWNTATDEITEGQWLKSRIYERRCDLSPNGELLLYFAASQKPPHGSWTAVSRPPYLTALALWPKGNAWGGGGHFETNTRLALNHEESRFALAEDFRLPRWLKVEPFGKSSGWGEDSPVWLSRLMRDGWTWVSLGQEAKKRSRKDVWVTFDPPTIFEKRRGDQTLQMTIYGIHQKNGPWYVTTHSLLTYRGPTLDLGESDWSDWSRSGEVLFARNGALHRIRNGEIVTVADLTGLTFTPREAPAKALRWR